MSPNDATIPHRECLLTTPDQHPAPGSMGAVISVLGLLAVITGWQLAMFTHLMAAGVAMLAYGAWLTYREHDRARVTALARAQLQNHEVLHEGRTYAGSDATIIAYRVTRVDGKWSVKALVCRRDGGWHGYVAGLTPTKVVSEAVLPLTRAKAARELESLDPQCHERLFGGQIETEGDRA